MSGTRKPPVFWYRTPVTKGPIPEPMKRPKSQMLPTEPTREGGDTASTVVQALLDETEWKNCERLKKMTDSVRSETSSAGMMHIACSNAPPAAPSLQLVMRNQPRSVMTSANLP